MTIQTEPPARARGSTAIPLIIGSAFLMEQIDATAIIAAIPEISRDFLVDPLRLNLAVTSYLFALAVFMPASGWVADRFGARRIFILAMCIFALGSLLCGVSTNLPMLVGARILQGIGGAFMTPIGRLILLRSASKSELVRAITLMTLPVLLGPLIGPVIGGFLVSYVDWRWIFFINLPLTLMVIVTALRVIKPVAPIPVTRFDLSGFLLSGAGLLLLQAALENVTAGYVPGWAGGVAALVSICLLLLFWLHSRRVERPVLDINLFKLRPFRVGLMAGGLCRIGLNAVPFLLQLQLQLEFGYSAFEAGLTVFVTAIGAVALKPMTRAILRRTGFKNLLIANALVTGVLVALLVLLDASTPIWLVWAHLAIFGLFRSLQFNSINSLTYADIPSSKQSASVGLAGAAQQLTMGLGVSISATVYALIGGNATPLAGSEAFSLSYLVMALFPLIAAALFLRLHQTDGLETSGRVLPEK